MGDALIALPGHVLHEFGFKGEVAHLVAAAVEIQQAIETDTAFAGHEGALGREGLQAAAGADAHQFERAVLGAVRTCGKVDVG